MTRKIPAAALEAATVDVQERLNCTQQMAERVARGALESAVESLPYRLFVARDASGGVTICRMMIDPDRPGTSYPATHGEMTSALAALLPDLADTPEG